MTRNDTELLIQKYLNGETTAEEERMLALEVSREDAPEDWKIIAGMLGELTIDEALFDQMMAARKQKPRIIKLWPWAAGIAAAFVVAVFIMREPVTTPTGTSCKSRLPEYHYKTLSPNDFSSYEDIVNEIECSGRQLENAIAQL